MVRRHCVYAPRQRADGTASHPSVGEVEAQIADMAATPSSPPIGAVSQTPLLVIPSFFSGTDDDSKWCSGSKVAASLIDDVFRLCVECREIMLLREGGGSRLHAQPKQQLRECRVRIAHKHLRRALFLQAVRAAGTAGSGKSDVEAEDRTPDPNACH